MHEASPRLSMLQPGKSYKKHDLFSYLMPLFHVTHSIIPYLCRDRHTPADYNSPLALALRISRSRTSAYPAASGWQRMPAPSTFSLNAFTSWAITGQVL